MTKFKYEGYPSHGYNVHTDTIAFSLSPNPKRHKRILTIPWATCRDHVSDAVIAETNGKSNWNRREEVPPFDMNKLRLIVGTWKENKPYVLAAKKILNVYEAAAGFKDRSIITDIAVARAGNDIGTWLITGPKEWMKCTQLISMCTLILRVCKNAGMKKDVKNLNEVEDIWANIKPGGSAYKRVDFTSMLPFCWPKWRVLMENFNEIFKGFGPKTLYPDWGVGRWHGPGGIFSLCKHATGIERLDGRFEEACVKAGVKYINYNDFYGAGQNTR